MADHSMLHEWREWITQRQSPDWREWFDERVAQSVVFHAGRAQDLPPPRPSNWVSVRPPFPHVVVEFDGVGPEGNSHYLLYCEELEGEDGFLVVPAQKTRGGDWITGYPLRGIRVPDGEYEFTSMAPDEARATLEPKWFMAAHVFDVLRCINVTTHDHPAPGKLNAKRVARGRAPLFSYKTLVLAVPNERRAVAALGGTHASPRIHLRRGHIRQLGDGRSVWVQSCVVGSKHGVIHKDYRLVAKAAAV